MGNKDSITVNEWVKLCYNVAGKEAKFVNVMEEIEQRSYFCFNDYDYYLDITEQEKIMPDTKSLEEGLREAYMWYVENNADVNKRGYIDYIDEKWGN